MSCFSDFAELSDEKFNTLIVCWSRECSIVCRSVYMLQLWAVLKWLNWYKVPFRDEHFWGSWELYITCGDSRAIQIPWFVMLLSHWSMGLQCSLPFYFCDQLLLLKVGYSFSVVLFIHNSDYLYYLIRKQTIIH